MDGIGINTVSRVLHIHFTCEQEILSFARLYGHSKRFLCSISLFETPYFQKFQDFESLSEYSDFDSGSLRENAVYVG